MPLLFIYFSPKRNHKRNHPSSENAYTAETILSRHKIKTPIHTAPAESYNLKHRRYLTHPHSYGQHVGLTQARRRK